MQAQTEAKDNARGMIQGQGTVEHIRRQELEHLGKDETGSIESQMTNLGRLGQSRRATGKNMQRGIAVTNLATQCFWYFHGRNCPIKVIRTPQLDQILGRLGQTLDLRSHLPRVQHPRGPARPQTLLQPLALDAGIDQGHRHTQFGQGQHPKDVLRRVLHAESHGIARSELVAFPRRHPRVAVGNLVDLRVGEAPLGVNEAGFVGHLLHQAVPPGDDGEAARLAGLGREPFDLNEGLAHGYQKAHITDQVAEPLDQNERVANEADDVANADETKDEQRQQRCSALVNNCFGEHLSRFEFNVWLEQPVESFAQPGRDVLQSDEPGQDNSFLRKGRA